MIHACPSLSGWTLDNSGGRSAFGPRNDGRSSRCPLVGLGVEPFDRRHTGTLLGLTKVSLGCTLLVVRMGVLFPRDDPECERFFKVDSIKKPPVRPGFGWVELGCSQYGLNDSNRLAASMILVWGYPLSEPYRVSRLSLSPRKVSWTIEAPRISLARL